MKIDFLLNPNEIENNIIEKKRIFEGNGKSE